MKKSLFTLVLLFVSICSFSQSLTYSKLLQVSYNANESQLLEILTAEGYKFVEKTANEDEHGAYNLMFIKNGTYNKKTDEITFDTSADDCSVIVVAYNAEKEITTVTLGLYSASPYMSIKDAAIRGGFKFAFKEPTEGGGTYYYVRGKEMLAFEEGVDNSYFVVTIPGVAEMMNSSAPVSSIKSKGIPTFKLPSFKTVKAGK